MKEDMLATIEKEAALVDKTVEVTQNVYLNKLYLEGKFGLSSSYEGS